MKNRKLNFMLVIWISSAIFFFYKMFDFHLKDLLYFLTTLLNRCYFLRYFLIMAKSVTDFITPYQFPTFSIKVTCQNFSAKNWFNEHNSKTVLIKLCVYHACSYIRKHISVCIYLYIYFLNMFGKKN